MKNETLHKVINSEYKLGFETIVNSETFPPGLNEDVIRAISKKKEEPQWLLDYRLKAYKKWLKMLEPKWANLEYTTINYQDISYFSAPKKAPGSLDEIDPSILKTYEKLGIPLEEQKLLAGIAVDAVFDSVSVKTTFQDELEKLGIIFCSISEAAQKHPELLKKYLSMEDDFERGAACIGQGFEGCAITVQNRFADRQPHAGATCLAACGKERFGNPSEIVGVDSVAVIRNFKYSTVP